MEITLEKIELVKDRTGVSYKEAKEALEAAEGSVVDAIIAIEENVDLKKSGKVSGYASETMKKIKEFVSKGNISKITVMKGEEIIANVPLNVGIVGAVVAPLGVVAAAVAAFGFKCKVVLTTDDGKTIDISEKTGNFASQVKDKGSVVVDEIKEKIPGAYEKAKDAGADLINNVKEKAPGAFQAAKEATQEKISEVKERFAEKDDFEVEFEFDEEVSEIKEEAAEEVSEIKEEVAEAVSEVKEEVEEVLEEIKEE